MAKKVQTQFPPDEPDLDGVGDTKIFKPMGVNEINSKITKQLDDFTALLDSISSIEEKTKSLWRDIYENSVQDRKNAYLMWADLYLHVHSNPNEHAIHGQNLSKYMERMSKANDQILKLAYLVADQGKKEIDDTMTEDEIYREINKNISNGH